MNYKEAAIEKRDSAKMIEQVGEMVEKVLREKGLSFEDICIEEEQAANGYRTITIKIISKKGDNPVWVKTKEPVHAIHDN